MTDIQFTYPWVLVLLLLIPLMVIIYIVNHKRGEPPVTFPAEVQFSNLKRTWREYLMHVLFGLKTVTALLLILIIARPYSSDRWHESESEGIDIMIALDVSGSMLAQDLKPDRIEAAKDISVEFISGRGNDRIGVVIFSGESFTQVPLTTDHATVINLLREAGPGMIRDGTAIGMGIATAVNRLKESDAASKVIILLTDGVNNMGEISPEMGAELARVFDIRIYTIGVGSEGVAPYPIQTPFGTQYRDIPADIDEEILKYIAEKTGGSYFRATDNEALRNVYEEIDRLERSVIEMREYSRREDEYLPLAAAAIAALLAWFLIRYGVMKRVA